MVKSPREGGGGELKVQIDWHSKVIDLCMHAPNCYCSYILRILGWSRKPWFVNCIVSKGIFPWFMTMEIKHTLAVAVGIEKGNIWDNDVFFQILQTCKIKLQVGVQCKLLHTCTVTVCI